jgi:hypothetical protein
VDVTVTCGEVSVKLRDVDLSTRQVHALLRSVAGIAVALGVPEVEPDRPPIGFAASIERAPEVYEDLSEYFED